MSILRKPKVDCYFWQDSKCQFPNEKGSCKHICQFFLKTTDTILDDMDKIQFVVTRSIAKITLYVCVSSLVVAFISLGVSLVSLLLTATTASPAIDNLSDLSHK